MASQSARKKKNMYTYLDMKQKRIILLQVLLESSEHISELQAHTIADGLLKELRQYGDAALPAHMIDALVNTQAINAGVTLSTPIILPPDFLMEEPIPLSINAIRVLQKRYLGKNEEGHIDSNPP